MDLKLPPFSVILFNLGIAFLAITVGTYLFGTTQHNLGQFSLHSPPKFKGPLFQNDELHKAQRLLKGQIHGPNSMLVERGSLFSNIKLGEVHEGDNLSMKIGMENCGRSYGKQDSMTISDGDGKIVQIVDGVIRKTMFLHNETCGGVYDEFKCGRPIAIRRFDKDRLIVADAYRGIYLVNFEKEKSDLIFSTDRVIEGKPIAFINDVDVYNTDTIVFTATSSKWDLRRWYHILLDHIPDGRVIRYSLSSKETTVVLDNLYFPNGIQIQPDRMSFLVAETGMARITRFHFKGPKENFRESVIENLPGYPDNIRLSILGTYYIGFVGVRHPSKFSLFEWLGPLPSLRHLLMQLIPEQQMVKLMRWFMPKYGLVVEIDSDGHILSSLHDQTGDIYETTEIADTGTHLYITPGPDKDFLLRWDKHAPHPLPSF